MYGSYEEIFCRAQLCFALKSFPFLPIRHGQKVVNFLFCLSARKKFSFPPLGQKEKFSSAFRPETNYLLQTSSGLARPGLPATPGSPNLLFKCKFRMEISCISTAPRWPPSTCVRIFPPTLGKLRWVLFAPRPSRLVKSFVCCPLVSPPPGDSWTG